MVLCCDPPAIALMATASHTWRLNFAAPVSRSGGGLSALPLLPFSPPVRHFSRAGGPIRASAQDQVKTRDFQ
jgi:hypothetical protein